MKFLEVKLSPQKSLWWIPILVVTCNISKNRLPHGHYPSGYCEKYHVQLTQLWSSILVKKTITRLALSRNLKNGVWLRRLLKSSYSFGNLKKKFWVSFYSKFACFFSKAAYWLMKISWKHHRGWGKNEKSSHENIQSPSHYHIYYLANCLGNLFPGLLQRQKYQIVFFILFYFIFFFFCSTNHSGDSHWSTSPNNNISFQLVWTWSCLKYMLNISC